MEGASLHAAFERESVDADRVEPMDATFW